MSYKYLYYTINVTAVDRWCSIVCLLSKMESKEHANGANSPHYTSSTVYKSATHKCNVAMEELQIMINSRSVHGVFLQCLSHKATIKHAVSVL